MIPLNVQNKRRSVSSKISGGGAKGINTRTYSEFLDLTNTLNTENYITEAEGDLVKRLGRILEKDITGSNALKVFKLSDEMWLLQYGTQISSYYEPTQTVTALETLSTSDNISAVKFGDYIFYTNGSSVIRYTTFDYGSNLVTLSDYEKTFTASSNTFHYWWEEGSGLRSMPDGTGTIIVESTAVDLSPTIGSKYKFDVTLSLGNSSQNKIIGFIPTIDLSSGTNSNIEIANNTNNLNFRATYNVTNTTTSVSETPSGTVDGVNTTFTVSNYYIDADIFIDGAGTPTTGCIFKGTTLTVPVAPTTSISLTGGEKLDSFTPNHLTNISIAEQDPTSLQTPSTLSSSPTGKKLFVYDSRLVIGNMVGDEGLVQYSQRYTTTNQESIPTTFNIWTTANDPLEPNDPGNIALRELGKVNDFFQLGSQLGILYDNGKAGYRITNDGVNQVVLQDFAYQDMGGNRAITTGQGVFYTNETGLWILASGGVTSQPFSSSESNPSRRVFSDEFLFGLDFTDSDLIHDYVRGLILISCKDAQSYNDLILWYNIENKSFGKITGWNVKNFMRVGNDIYCGDSNDTQIYKLFSGTSDAGSNITSILKQEVQGRDLRALLETIVKGEFNASTNLTINFDVYDKNGTLTANFLTTSLSVTGDGADFQRWAERTRIREYSKIVMTVTSTDQVAHKINEIELVVQQKGSNRKFNA